MLVGACLWALPGCKVGPEFSPPEPPAAAQTWKRELSPQATDIPREWWTVYGDAALDGLVKQSLAENQDLQIALARVQQARAVARQDAADFYPDITGGSAFTRERLSGNRPVAPGAPQSAYTSSRVEVPFDLSYEIDVWGRVRSSFEAASSAADATELDRIGTQLTVSGDVARTYFAIRTLDAEAQVLREAVDLRKRALELIDGRYRSGVGSELDVSRTQTELATTEADLRAVIRQRAALENALAVLCGQTPQAFSLPVDPAMPAVVNVPTGLPSELLQRRPDIAAATARMREANARVGVATAAFYPTFHLTGSAGLVSDDLGSVFQADSRAWSIMPSISIPVFEGGRNEAKLRETEAFYRERESVYKQTLLVAFREVEDSLSSLEQLQSEIEFQTRAQQSADRTFELASGRYRQGLVSFLDVVDAARSQLDARRAQVRLKGARAESTVLLIKALGGGWRLHSPETAASAQAPAPQ